MSSRPIVSYDDITLPYDQPETPVNPPASSSHSAHPPPSKKRKKNNNHQKAKRRQDSNVPRNGPNPQTVEFQKYLSNTNNFAKTQLPQTQTHEEVEGEEGEYEYGYEEEEESRELTHEEIWDDSALVDAWEAAMEEYEAYHGTGKDWKKEPVKKSPLWYNVPFDPSKKPAPDVSSKSTGITTHSTLSTEGAENDSKPIDFDTFVPTHDPSLDIPSAPVSGEELPTMPSEATYIPNSMAGSIVSQDEAFQRALTAMYWGGYWTAMYHSQRQLAQNRQSSTATAVENISSPVGKEEEENDDEEVEELDGGDESDVVDEFIPTQR